MFICVACDGTRVTEKPVAAPPPEVVPASSPAESWQCRNDLEVSCIDGACGVETADGFTPMDVSFDDSGAMSVCAYSGCWQGTGEVVRSGDFLILMGQGLKFATARDDDSANANIVIAVDRVDRVATLKAGTFALPLLCERSESVP